MTWWGKVVGGAFGFLLGGPLGMMLGAALGHGFDKGLSQEFPLLMGRVDPQAGVGDDVENVQSAFFTATFTVLGHLAKSDGRVSADEISMARGVMAQMRLSEEQQRVAIKLFEQGKQPDFPLDETLEQFRKLSHRRQTLLQMFMEILVGMALADKAMHEGEHRVLGQVALKLGFSAQDYRAILRRMQAEDQFHQPKGRESLEDAYRLLGLGRSASVDEIKRSYRRLMSQHHPDKLVSKGLPQEMMDIATQKTRDIQAAYDQIRKSRGF